ncbi:hypothetical protein GWI33_004362 [Rhynchophorus ferrugineus]|uniref:Uncharacterized protein n=1 Tax=Rhynchophorus ferrugineus TaxID=354439 RepID=A0A834MP53_RHYFE|nr:hypothetical protein GWI33_004362 [Rhynchophorus ferrugineus]
MNRFSVVVLMFIVTAVLGYGVQEDYGGIEEYGDQGGFFNDNHFDNNGFEYSDFYISDPQDGSYEGGYKNGEEEAQANLEESDGNKANQESAHGGQSGGNGHDSHHVPHYHFSYGVHDPHTKDHKTHQEYRDHDKVVGSYTLQEPDGTHRIVEYTADKHNGFRAVVRHVGHAHHDAGHGNHGGHVGHSFVRTTHWGFGSG